MWSVVAGLTIVIWSVVGGLTTVIWSVVGCCSGRWSVFSQLLVNGRRLFRSVVGVTVVSGWSVGGGFVLRPEMIRDCGCFAFCAIKTQWP